MNAVCCPTGDLQANCVILWDDQGNGILVDPGDDAPLLLHFLDDRNITVRAVLLTHAHFDHMLAVREIQEKTGAPLYIHEADAPALSNAALSLIPFSRLPYSLQVDRLLKDGDEISVGTMSLSVIHTPGHTPGSSCFLGEDVLIAGDTLFCGGVGRTDLPGGSTAELIRSLRRLAALPGNLRVFCGHGEETTIAYECRYNPFLAGV